MGGGLSPQRRGDSRLRGNVLRETMLRRSCGLPSESLFRITRTDS